MKNIISHTPTPKIEDTCSCRDTNTCPLDNSCNTESIIYEAEVTTTRPNLEVVHKKYIGMTEGRFKQRFYNHKSSFKYTEKRNATKLASYIWDLKDKGSNFNFILTNMANIQTYRM